MWLNITNFALGLVTLVALLVVLLSVGWDLLARKAKVPARVDLRNIDADLKALLYSGSHSFTGPELGLTMADGGEKIEPKSETTNKKSQE